MSAETNLGELRDAAIQVLTKAARLRTADGDQPDMGDFVAYVVTSAAANLGGPEPFLSARLCSWESDYLYRLIEGTIGHEPSGWYQFRTEPIFVPLNITELIEASGLHPGLLGLSDAANLACDRILAELGGTPETEYRMDQAVQALESHYTTAYRDYGERFRAVVGTLAAEMNLPAIEVELDVNPESVWWEACAIRNSDPWGDPVIDDLWQRAHDVTRLPDILIAPISQATEGGDNDGDI